MKPSRSPRYPFLVPALGLALLVRLPGLGESFWYDEVFYTAWSFEQGSLGFLLSHDVHPPLYTLVMWGWSCLAGDREWLTRLPSLLFGLATLPPAFSLARRWLGESEAVLAVLLLALSPAHIWYSQENKVNMLAVLLTTLLVWGLQRVLDHGRRRDWLFFAAVSCLALWSHSFALPVAALAMLWLWWRILRDPGRRAAPALAVTLAVGLALLPLAWQALANPGQLSRGYLRPFNPGEAYRLFLAWLPHGNTLGSVNPYAPFSAFLRRPPAWFLVDAFLAVLLLAGISGSIRAAAREPGRGTGLLPLWLLLPPAALLVLSLVQPKVYIERNLLPVLPPFAIALARGVTSLKPRKAALAAGLALVILQAGAVWNLHWGKGGTWTVYKPNPDWRSAARWLREESAAQGVRAVVATSPDKALRFYLEHGAEGDPAATAPRVHQAMGKDLRWVRRRLREDRARSFLLVHELPWSASFPSLRKQLGADPRFRVTGVTRFPGVDIHRVELTPRKRPGSGERARGGSISRG